MAGETRPPMMAIYVKQAGSVSYPHHSMSTTRTTLTLGQSLCRRATLQKLALGTANNQCRRHSNWFPHTFTVQRRVLAASRTRLAGWPPPRHFSQSTRASLSAGTQASALDPRGDSQPAAYHGPLTQTFRRLKIFSLASLGLTFTMAPFLFIVESSLPVSARIFLTATAVSTSSISTALVGWCGAPYVVDLRRLTPAENDGMEGIEMTTLTLTLKKLTTRVYDSDFLVATSRPFAKWELPLAIQLPPSKEDVVAAGKAGAPGEEETVAETLNDKGEVIGRWIVTWGEGGTGTCRGTGKVLR